MAYEVIFTPEANRHLAKIYEYIEGESSPETAQRFTNSIVDYCNGFSIFPNRGTQRDDLRHGLRIVGFRRRGVIAIAVKTNRVFIIGVFYGGQDYEAALLPDE